MLKSFIISFQLKNTYRVNSIIYSIKQLPIIKKILSDSLYESRELKTIGNVISILWELATIFFGKLIYVFFMIALLSPLYETAPDDTFLHLFLFLTLCGGLLNTFMFNPTKDKYYALIIMNMDARRFTLSNYYYHILKTLIGFMPFTILFSILNDLPWWFGVLLAVFVIMVKMTISCYYLLKYEKTQKAPNKNLPSKLMWAGIVLLLAAAYGLPFLKITINQTSFLIIFAFSFLLWILSFIKINNFGAYRRIYKEILTATNVHISTKETQTAIIKESLSKQIEFTETATSEKEGYGYFHELFVKRHRKILTKAVKKQTVILLVIFLVAFATLFFNPKAHKEVNTMLMTYLPFFVLIMYMLNRGTVYSQALFMNCDHSMLTYRIYKTPKVILGLFKERLKTLMFFNLIPALVIAIGLPLLLFITGGTDNILNYVVLFTSIISMSLFFSVHYLVMYYLLQPYTVSTEMKSSTYTVVQWLTYFVCYIMFQIELPTLFFGAVTIIFSILYSLISLFLVYKYAPKTFKLRL